MWRRLLPVFGLCSAMAAACSDSESPRGGGEAGAGGAGEGGAGGVGGAGGADCGEDGKGTLEIEVTGLPSAVSADVTIDGPAPQSATDTVTIDDVTTGSYTVTAARVFDDDPIVRTVYEPKVTGSSFCLADGSSQSVTVAYTAIPSSNQLWTANGPGGTAGLLGFASASLDATGAPAATVAAEAAAGSEVAFDRDGNLWSKGPTSADPLLVRYPAAELGTSGEKEWDIGLNPEIGCLPSVRALAFDPDGNLWLSACGNEVQRIAASALVPAATAKDVAASVTLSGFTDNQDLAFDADGNLWVADGGKVVRFDAARLAASDADAPDRAITARDAADERDLSATFLAFDVDGNLWGGDFGSNHLFQLSAADLAGTGEVTTPASVSFVLGVTALLNRPAFDDSGALWISLTQGRFGALSAAQLTTSSGTGDPVAPSVVISSGDVGYANNIAFFPAAVGLPLYHSLP